MRAICLVLIVCFASGCTVPEDGDVDSNGGDGPLEPEPGAGNRTHDAVSPVVPIPPDAFRTWQTLGLEVYNGTWGRHPVVAATGNATMDEAVLELASVIVPVHVRTNASVPNVQVHAWSMDCCGAGASTTLVDGRGILHLGPGSWHLEAFGFDNDTHHQDSMQLEVRVDWTVEGTVWPAVVQVPEYDSMHEIRIATDGWARNLLLRLSTEGEVRDLRMAVLQSDYLQCSEPPRPGDLSNEETFMEARVDPMTRTVRVQVGDVTCGQGVPPLNVGAASYRLRISL